MKSKAKKIIATLIVLAMTICLFTACSSSGGTESSSASDTETEQESGEESEDSGETPTLGICLYALDAEFFASLEHWLTVSAEAQGWEVVSAAGELSDPSSQVDIIENFITMGVDAIFISPISTEAVEDALSKAKDAGILICGHNIQPEDSDTPDIYCTAGVPYATGELISEFAYECAQDNMDESVEPVIALLTALDNENNSIRCQGMEDKANELFGDGSIVASSEASDTAEAMTVAENIYTSHPDVNVWICYNDTTAMGVYQFYKASGMDSDNVVVVGMDGNSDALSAIEEGSVFRGTLSQAAYLLCDEYVNAIVEMYNGDIEGAQDILDNIGFFPVTIDNVAEFIENAEWE